MHGIKSNQKGITLIEVLVALLILAFGTLGMAGLQAVSMRNNNSAYFRSQATFLAYDMLDAMRANRDEALNGNYDIDFGEDETDVPGGAKALTKNDVQLWVSNLDDLLPSGSGAIDCSTISNVCEVQVRWDDSRQGNLQIFELSSRL